MNIVTLYWFENIYFDMDVAAWFRNETLVIDGYFMGK
jgi:hypothetical protein